MKHRPLLALLPLLACLLALNACGGDEDEDSAGSGSAPGGAGIEKNAANAKTTITVGSKNFTEQKVLGEIYAQGLEAAGYTVRTQLSLGDEAAAQAALASGAIDGYPEYTGTALLSLCDVPAAEVPKDPAQAFDDAKACMARDGLAALEPTPFTSSNEVGVLKTKAEELGLQKISDLEDKAGELTLYGSPECRTRQDCLLGLQEVYGLKFKKFTPVDIDQRHEVLKSGDADLSIVFTTDPQIQRNGEVLLEDDKGMFPPYNSTFLVKQETLDAAGPDLQKAVEAVNEQLTDEVMQELNARIDLDKETPEQAAADYLQQFKLVG